MVMSVISLSEVAFKRFEVDSLVDSAQTWHVDTPRASGFRVPASFPQTAISLGISGSVSIMSCLGTASTRTTPLENYELEKVLFIDMCTLEIRYRHPWLNSSVQHRVECIFAGTGASALRQSAVPEQNFAANNNFGLPRFTRDVGLPQIWHHVCL